MRACPHGHRASDPNPCMACLINGLPDVGGEPDLRYKGIPLKVDDWLEPGVGVAVGQRTKEPSQLSVSPEIHDALTRPVLGADIGANGPITMPSPDPVAQEAVNLLDKLIHQIALGGMSRFSVFGDAEFSINGLPLGRGRMDEVSVVGALTRFMSRRLPPESWCRAVEADLKKLGMTVEWHHTGRDGTAKERRDWRCWAIVRTRRGEFTVQPDGETTWQDAFAAIGVDVPEAPE